MDRLDFKSYLRIYLFVINDNKKKIISNSLNNASLARLMKQIY